VSPGAVADTSGARFRGGHRDPGQGNAADDLRDMQRGQFALTDFGGQNEYARILTDNGTVPGATTSWPSR
jgi:hypothetical protein